jgi:hypothetical protein
MIRRFMTGATKMRCHRRRTSSMLMPRSKIWGNSFGRVSTRLRNRAKPGALRPMTLSAKPAHHRTSRTGILNCGRRRYLDDRGSTCLTTQFCGYCRHIRYLKPPRSLSNVKTTTSSFPPPSSRSVYNFLRLSTARPRLLSSTITR